MDDAESAPPAWEVGYGFRVRANLQPRIRHISGIGVHELTLEATSPAKSSGFLSPTTRARRSSTITSLERPVVRARAPTLAGEGKNPHIQVAPVEAAEDTEVPARPLAKCFITMTIPEHQPLTNGTSNDKSTQAKQPLPPAVPGVGRPKVTRSRTTSLPPMPEDREARERKGKTGGRASGSSSPTSTRRPVASRRSTMGLAPQSGRPAPVPFFFSPIHDPSTNPWFRNLEPSGDFASWLTTTENAGTKVDVGVWVEERGRWRRLRGVGGLVDLSHLAPVPVDAPLPANTVEFTLSTHPRMRFCIPPTGSTPPRRDPMKGVVERSLRETRMKKGANAGALHQLVSIQSAISETQQQISELQAKIDCLLKADADRSTLRRDMSELALKTKWVRDRVEEVDHTTEEARARNTLHRSRLSARRALLNAAIERTEITRAEATKLAYEITEVETKRTEMLPQIHKKRAQHAQALDQLFPIVPVDASTLIYSICGVPLPIPQGPKDPAPPLSLPPAQTPEGCPRIDERTTSAALGYAALLVQLISNLGGTAAGLAYPVTYGGSRSHVRDVVSVMQGPRSFPLYGKNVERYRYEYAVFLLNKDIELLMHEWDLRMLDLRQTLPNLKNLLLMLSSPDPPAPGPVTGPGWASGAASRASSRRPSSAYPHSRSASLVWSPYPASRSTSIASLVWSPDSPLGAGKGFSVPSPRWEDSLAGASVESVVSSTSVREISTPRSPGEKRDDLTGQVLKPVEVEEPESDTIDEEDDGYESEGTADGTADGAEAADSTTDTAKAVVSKHEASLPTGGAEDGDDASSDRTQVE